MGEKDKHTDNLFALFIYKYTKEKDKHIQTFFLPYLFIYKYTDKNKYTNLHVWLDLQN